MSTDRMRAGGGAGDHYAHKGIWKLVFQKNGVSANHWAKGLEELNG